MKRRYVIVADLDDAPFDDARRDFIHLIGPAGRERSIHEVLARDVPGLAVQSVQEIQNVEVSF